MSLGTEAFTVEVARIALPGPLVGVGIDLLEKGRVSERLAARRFAESERAAFSGARELPFCAREAILKAVGGPGILAAPLQEIVVGWVSGRLALSPGPRYAAIMGERGVRDVRLIVIDAHESHTLVAGLAHRDGEPMTCEVAWASGRASATDGASLSEAELEFARSRPRPHLSIATRAAAHAALSALGVTAIVEGGGGDPPRLTGLPGAFVSLSHEDDLVAALIAFPIAFPLGPVDAGGD